MFRKPMFYAFYAKNWQGALQLRGLSEKSYKVVDYVNNRDMGVINKEKPELNAGFDNSLLIMAYPVK